MEGINFYRFSNDVSSIKVRALREEDRHSNPVALLVLFVVVATATPGGATTLAAASGARFGFVRSMPLIAGGAFGLAACASLPFWCMAGAVLARRLRTPLHWRLFNTTMAVLLAASIVPIWR
ncbi:hypothetical protein SAMN05445871_5110 [Paraburkholderia caballeronis]|uniref:LysE type translocator n=1 Tax=Paraburkholderia caballeronis TaxID=416943 RepID=A0A1H7ST71_9BURK|nr:hypothetical protein C7403_105318 [Paraburkholderia caballeronis]PXX01242.1 hypothetical protein C7407_105317 [Paraburkholderia caballeronis]RAJ99405.1 hypothetical protein C7409_105134 [Paraburkholderia caballeronis]SEE29314.1 hypothetical protein SAMN05445871_5110 [Paraburkholderia caballeronis]SEL75763.1 hypothetical protein SAMN05192542_11318 [Paraburkholderia caballeronis]